MKISSNIFDTALVIEGGGMRCSYTAGIVTKLLEEELFFNYVTGISAGASNGVNYLSRDKKRVRESFVEIVKDDKFGGWISFLKGEGFFRSKYIYEETPLPGGALEYDFDTFLNNPAEIKIGSFLRDTGEMIYYSKEDMKKLNDLMKIVRASSSLPFFMPQTKFNGKHHLDGGLGGGVPLDIALRDGYKKFFIVLSRPKGFRKEPYKNKLLVKVYYRKYPQVARAILTRYQRYNDMLDKIEELVKLGIAYAVYPKRMSVGSNETDYNKLAQNYEYGYNQAKDDIYEWKEFLYK
jgi:predicted patatin/cPLA2 family phospholipase